MPPIKRSNDTRLKDDMWQECLDDCAGDEEEAKKQYQRIQESLLRQIKAKREQARVKRARADDYRDDDDEESDDGSVGLDEHDSSSGSTASESEESDHEAHNKPLMRWSKPGALARRVGVSQSVLRGWARANVVQTMVSPGGHRLFNVKSVERHIAAAAVTKKLRHNAQRQLLVYVRFDGVGLDQKQLDVKAEQIKSQVSKQFQSSCTESELQSCTIIVELESEAKRAAAQPGSQSTHKVAHTPGTRQLLQAICNRDRSRTLVVLRTVEDISCVPSTYAFFLLLCRNMGAEVQIFPELLQ